VAADSGIPAKLLSKIEIFHEGNNNENIVLHNYENRRDAHDEMIA